LKAVKVAKLNRLLNASSPKKKSSTKGCRPASSPRVNNEGVHHDKHKQLVDAVLRDRRVGQMLVGVSKKKAPAREDEAPAQQEEEQEEEGGPTAAEQQQMWRREEANDARLKEEDKKRRENDKREKEKRVREKDKKDRLKEKKEDREAGRLRTAASNPAPTISQDLNADGDDSALVTRQQPPSLSVTSVTTLTPVTARNGPSQEQQSTAKKSTITKVNSLERYMVKTPAASSSSASATNTPATSSSSSSSSAKSSSTSPTFDKESVFPTPITKKLRVVMIQVCHCLYVTLYVIVCFCMFLNTTSIL
jgi:hypothetical protein